MDLSTNTSLAPLAELIAAVNRAALEAEAEIFVAGAFARDLWLEFGHHLPTGRATTDVDFAVECQDWTEFQRLRTALIAGGEFTPTRTLHKLRHRHGTDLDVIPYGNIERKDRHIAWPEGNSVLNVLGFAEVRATVTKFTLPGGVTVPVVSLAALALLKLIAWGDDYNSRRRDAYDIALISRKYLDAGNLERAYELIRVDEAFDYEVGGAELLGRDISALCQNSLRSIVGTLLNRETDANGALMLAGSMSLNEDLALRLLGGLKRGFETGHEPTTA